MPFTHNVLDHGADPTGLSNSNAAFDAAIAAANGGIVCIPPGRYQLTTMVIRKPVTLRGAGGVFRTGPGGLEGSATTLIFPANVDGFVLQARVQIEDLAIVRTRGTGEVYDRRGIYSTHPCFLRRLYLVRWERGIEINGKASEGHNPNTADIESIYVEDGLWATYVYGENAQSIHVSHVHAFQCFAGIYDSSTGGNGYFNCYMEQADSVDDPALPGYNLHLYEAPYYIDNQSLLSGCRAEPKYAPQIAHVAAFVQGTTQIPIVGLPATLHSLPIIPFTLAAARAFTLTVDGMERTVTLPRGRHDHHSVARQINAVFATTPRTAIVDQYRRTIHIRSGIPQLRGSISVSAPATVPSILASIGLADMAGKTAEGIPPACILSTGAGMKSQNIMFYSTSLPESDAPLTAIQVELAKKAKIALQWQMVDPDGTGPLVGEAHEFSLMHVREPRSSTRPKMRWVIARHSSELNASIGFTAEALSASSGDEMGADQLLAYKGVWLYGHSTSVLLINRVPDDLVGRDGDVAWDMSQYPQVHYRKVGGAWRRTAA